MDVDGCGGDLIGRVDDKDGDDDGEEADGGN